MPMPVVFATLTDAWGPEDKIELIKHYDGDVGFDLPVSRDVTIQPGEWSDVPSGVKIALPPGYWALIIGRSSTFTKRGLIVNPGCGVIDNGWRGELFCMAYNITRGVVHVKRGERLAQFLPQCISPIMPQVQIVEPHYFPAGTRGEKGFGSTGGFNYDDK
jgi:dUTP pyrophosphatase